MAISSCRRCTGTVSKAAPSSPAYTGGRQVSSSSVVVGGYNPSRATKGPPSKNIVVNGSCPASPELKEAPISSLCDGGVKQNWLRQLGNRAKGKLMIFIGECAYKFASSLEGPLRYDVKSGEIEVKYPDFSEHLYSDEGFIESGYLPLAKYEERDYVNEEGCVEKLGVIEHGIQQIEDTDEGGLAALGIDCDGMARFDRLKPLEFNSNENALPEGFSRLASYEMDSEGCEAKKRKFVNLTGARYTSDEITEIDGKCGLPVVAERVDGNGCDGDIILRTKTPEVLEAMPEDTSNLYIQVFETVKDEDCDKIVGVCPKLIPVDVWNEE